MLTQMLAFMAVLSSFATQAPKPADPKDVATTDVIIAAVYDTISGPIGKKRDWDRMRSLFVRDAKMMAVGRQPDGTAIRYAMTVEDYITRSGPVLETRGFFEKEVARRVDQFASIAHVFSTYEARSKADDEKPIMRGINSFQLFNDGKRWWVVTILWQAEDAANPLQEKYRKSGK